MGLRASFIFAHLETMRRRLQRGAVEATRTLGATNTVWHTQELELRLQDLISAVHRQKHTASRHPEYVHSRTILSTLCGLKKTIGVIRSATNIATNRAWQTASCRSSLFPEALALDTNGAVTICGVRHHARNFSLIHSQKRTYHSEEKKPANTQS